MNYEFPKLLVSTEFPPNASGGGPAVIRQVLKQWPTDRLFWWSCLPEVESRFGQRVSRHSTAAIPSRWYPQIRLARAKSLVLSRFWSPWAARRLRAVIEEIRPDAIWAVPHAWSILPLSKCLPECGVGFNVSVHDFVDVHAFPRQVGRRNAKGMAKLVEDLYSRADTRDVISTEMGSEMFEITGKRASQTLRYGIEAEEFQFLQREIFVSRSVVRIAYAGSIAVPEDFAFFVSALAAVRTKLGRTLEFHLFGSHSFRRNMWFDPTWMIERGNLPEPDLSLALRECDWGFSLMSMAESDPRYSRFSFPTKFISYLATGLPVVSLGHQGSSLMNMAARYQVGYSSCSPSKANLTEGLLQAFSDPMPRARYRSEILRCARDEFDAAKMRQSFYRCVERCSERTRIAGTHTQRRKGAFS